MTRKKRGIPRRYWAIRFFRGAKTVKDPGGLAFAIGIALAWYGASLFKVSAACCLIVFGVELLLC